MKILSLTCTATSVKGIGAHLTKSILREEIDYNNKD